MIFHHFWYVWRHKAKKAFLVIIFDNIKITNAMSIQRLEGSFNILVNFKNAAGEPVTIDHLTGVTLTSSDSNIASVDTFDPATGIGTGTGKPNADGTNGLATLSLDSVNNVGDHVTATVDLEFVKAVDNTAVSAEITIS